MGASWGRAGPSDEVAGILDCVVIGVAAGRLSDLGATVWVGLGVGSPVCVVVVAGRGTGVGVGVARLSASGRAVGPRPHAEVNAGSTIRINNVSPKAIMANSMLARRMGWPSVHLLHVFADFLQWKISDGQLRGPGYLVGGPTDRGSTLRADAQDVVNDS